MKTCNKCGNEWDDGFKFCGVCGSDLGEPGVKVILTLKTAVTLKALVQNPLYGAEYPEDAEMRREVWQALIDAGVA